MLGKRTFYEVHEQAMNKFGQPNILDLLNFDLDIQSHQSAYYLICPFILDRRHCPVDSTRRGDFSR